MRVTPWPLRHEIERALVELRELFPMRIGGESDSVLLKVEQCGRQPIRINRIQLGRQGLFGEEWLGDENSGHAEHEFEEGAVLEIRRANPVQPALPRIDRLGTSKRTSFHEQTR